MSAPDRRSGAPVPGSGRGTGVARKEIRELLGQIEAAGGTVKPSCNKPGHFKVYLDGRFIGGISGTPSDYRSTKNEIARLRRRGLPLNSKGRYEP